ncbi:MAG: hypothetical protein OHK0013_43720 [Sandaracinaceae bacterium]
MRVVASTKRPCRLERGEVRRVPQDRDGLLVGYHVCCPRCGFITAALEGDAGLDITEGAAPDDLTFSRALRCTFCRVLLHLHHGQLRLEEDADVRNVRYR